MNIFDRLMQKKETGTKELTTFKLPLRLGGGEFNVDPSDRGGLVTTPRNAPTSLKNAIRGGSFVETEKEIDHTIPKSLGGTDSPYNLTALESKKSLPQRLASVFGRKYEAGEYADRQEGKYETEKEVIKKFQAGEMTLGQARGEVLKKQREITGLDPKQGVSSYLWEGFKEIFTEPAKTIQNIKTTAGSMAESYKAFKGKVGQFTEISEEDLSKFGRELVDKGGRVALTKHGMVAVKDPETGKFYASDPFGGVGKMRNVAKEGLDKIGKQLLKNIKNAKLPGFYNKVGGVIKIGEQNPIKILQSGKAVVEKTADSVIHIPEKGVYAEINPKQLEGLKNEVKNIPWTKTDRPHLTAVTDNLLAKNKKISIEEIKKISPNIKKALDDIAPKSVKKAEAIIQEAREQGIAIVTKPNGTQKAAIRKSGVFAEDAYQVHPFRHKVASTDNFQAFASTMDNVPEHEIAEKSFGPMMRLYNKLSSSAAEKIQFANTYKQKIANSLKGIKNKEIVEQILDGKTPKGMTEAHQKAAKEIREALDSLRKQANTVRESLGKDKIGYIKEYSPRIRETSVWQEIIQAKDTTISDVMDFIVPNMKMNPHAKRRILEEMQGKKVPFMKAMDRYVDAISSDVYLTPMIEKLKAVKEVLQGREMFKASKYIDDFIRHNLVSKPAKMATQLDLTGKIPQKIMGKVVQARNLGALVFNLTWSFFVQPASIVNTVARGGLRNTLRGALDWTTKPALRKEIMETPTMIRKTARGIGTTLGGDVDRAASALYKTKIDKVNDVLAIISNGIEKHITGLSIATGLRRAEKLGIKGADRKIYAQYIGEVTQSMYDKVGRPLTLNPAETRLLFPFQTFAHEMYRYAKTLTGRGGGIPLKKRQRLGQAVSLITGMYVWNEMMQKTIGRDIGSPGTFIPFIGGEVDKRIQGERAGTGRAPVAPFEDVDKMIKAVSVFTETGSWEKLRKEVLFWGMGLAGIGGASQLNRTIDGLIAIEKGYSETPKGEERFPVEGLSEDVRALIGGPFTTKAGMEYISNLGLSKTDVKIKEMEKMGQEEFNAEMSRLKKEEPQLFSNITKEYKYRSLGLTEEEKKLDSVAKKDRAAAIFAYLRKQKNPEETGKKLEEAGIITPEIKKEIAEMLK